ncbi:NAD(P)-dependent oxidoreductase [Actinocorallia longicatena]|uniref:NAD(P)-dependent oxidoreductase n=1 Tax=Actinocorallia longicatena TaxID=111803 RepID=A0ABP6QA29_9ACTN
MTSDTILVTGAFGSVGAEVVRHLTGQGRRVTATDLDVPSNRRKAASFRRAGAEVRWADLTRDDEVHGLLARTEPMAIIHLAAVIPPFCYARPGLAHRVNVDATAALIQGARDLPSPPRFVQASSVAVHGPRNPHRHTGLLTPTTPLNPSDVYGEHKARVEERLMASGLDWAILRIGGVIVPEPHWHFDLDLVTFQGMLPVDGRIHTVDARDAARAFGTAATAGVPREVYLIGGDPTHRVRQGDLAPAIAAVMGLGGGLPPGRPGDPGRDQAWFATDWMDTTRAQEVLSFQRHPLPDTFREIETKVGWRRRPLSLIAPALRGYLRRRSAPYETDGPHADPWTEMSARWGSTATEPVR